MSQISLIANQKSRRKLRKDSLCPCDSGKKYGDCCKKRQIEYSYDNEGNLVRVIPFNDNVKEAYLGALESYKQIFGRESVDDDSPFLEVLLYSDEERIEKSIEILKYGFGVSDEDLYAYKKLGILVTKENKKQASAKDIQLWNKTKKEYRDIQSGKIKKEINHIEYYFEELEDWVVRLIYLYALLLFKSESKYKNTLRLYHSINLNSYVLFCLTKNLKSLKATRALTTHNFNEDAFSIIRSMYENYLQITTAAHNPTQLLKELRVKIGLQEGTHVQEKDYIIEKATSHKTKVLNNRQRAALDIEFNNENMIFYNSLYQYFSFYVHPDIRIANAYFKDGYLSHNNSESKNIIFYYINYVNIVLLFDLLKLDIFSGQCVLDIKYFIRNIVELLLIPQKDKNNFMYARLTKMLKSKRLK
jgi:hypothetical protein